MTKNEIIFGGILTDEQVFEKDIANVALHCRSLSLVLGSFLYKSNVLDYHQKNRLSRFAAELASFQRELSEWRFKGELDQLPLGFDFENKKNTMHLLNFKETELH